MFHILQKSQSLKSQISGDLSSVHLERNHSGNYLHKSLYLSSVRDINATLGRKFIVYRVVHDIFHSWCVCKIVFEVKRIIPFLNISGKILQRATPFPHFKTQFSRVIQKIIQTNSLKIKSFIKTQILTKRESRHIVLKHPARKVCQTAFERQQRTAAQDDMQLRIKVINFLYFNAPFLIFVNLINEKMGSAKFHKISSCIQKAVIGKISRIGRTIQNVSVSCRIIEFDALSEQSGFSHSLWPPYADQAAVPTDLVHKVADILCRSDPYVIIVSLK